MPYSPIIVDAHEDLAYTALTFGRDYTQAALDTRQREAANGSIAPAHTMHTMLGWPEYQKARIAVVFGTLFTAGAAVLEDWQTQLYRSTDEARRIWQMQVEYYQRLAGDFPDQFQQVLTRADLRQVLSTWQEEPHANGATPKPHPVGLVMLMENAEGLKSPREMEEWAEKGVRLVGPVWAADGQRFCGGKNSPEGFSREGLELLDVMAGLGLALDLSHMNERSALQALDRYEGPVVGTHANCRALLHPTEHTRHFTDAVIRRLAERDGVMGVLPWSKWLRPDWSAEEPREQTTLAHLAAHIDHICQLAGDAHHAGIGSDFDGGFGWPEVPAELETIADLPKLAGTLAGIGYTEQDIAAVMGGNWLNLLERVLPER